MKPKGVRCEDESPMVRDVHVNVSGRLAKESEDYHMESLAAVYKTGILTLLVVVSNVIGNLMLSLGMHRVGRIVSASPADYVRALADPWTISGVCILLIWMGGNLALLSTADLSFVLPVTASAYVPLSLAGHFILHDQISWARWLGILVITLGVILADETPARTTKGLSDHLA